MLARRAAELPSAAFIPSSAPTAPTAQAPRACARRGEVPITPSSQICSASAQRVRRRAQLFPAHGARSLPARLRHIRLHQTAPTARLNQLGLVQDRTIQGGNLTRHVSPHFYTMAHKQARLLLS